MTSYREGREETGTNGEDRLRADLLARRLSAVGEVSALNARHLKLIQQCAGIEMEALRLELELQRHPEDASLPQALEDIHSQLDAARAGQDACAEQLDGCESGIAEIDRQLASLMARPRGGQDEPA